LALRAKAPQDEVRKIHGLMRADVKSACARLRFSPPDTGVRAVRSVAWRLRAVFCLPIVQIA